MSPDGRFLYAAECVAPTGANAADVVCGTQSILATYAVNQTNGNLTLAGSQPLPASYTFPQIVAMGSFVFAATRATQTLDNSYAPMDYTGAIMVFSAAPNNGHLTPKSTTNTSGGAAFLVGIPGS